MPLTHFSYHEAVTESLKLRSIVSGGQTGVDRAALDAAIWLGIPHGGWCPSGRRSEDGPIPEQYLLRETEASDYSVRTERNVVDSTATLILYYEALSGGTKLTVRLAEKHRRPHLLVDLCEDVDPDVILQWLAEEGVETLNVAGPRESSCPGIGEISRQLLVDLLRDLPAS